MKRYIRANTYDNNLESICFEVCNYIREHITKDNYTSVSVAEYNNKYLDAHNAGLMFFFDTASDIDYTDDRLSLEIRSFGEETLLAIDLYGKDILSEVTVYREAQSLIDYFLTEYVVYGFNSLGKVISESDKFENFVDVRKYIRDNPLVDGGYYRVGRYLYDEYIDDCSAKLKIPNTFEPVDLREEFKDKLL